MTAEQFVYWLQGFMEMSEPQSLSEKQTTIIKDHLKLVFDKQTPDRNRLLTETPTTPYPGIMYPDQYTYPPPYTITCTNGEGHNIQMNDPNKKFCDSTEIHTSHGVPQHMFGLKEEDAVGTDSQKILSKEKKKFRGGLKC